LIEVAISTIRPNRMDWAIEKLTELGVQSIVPLHCHFTNYWQIKREHLQKIAISAMKQSRQYFLPEIKDVVSLEEWLLGTSQQSGVKFLAHPRWEQSEKINTSRLSEKFFIAVGPEGGFHPDEISHAGQVGFELLPLGQTILRTETAAVRGVVQLKILKSQLFK